jgi:hypothetical protein
MPGAVIATHKLPEFTPALNEKVRRDLQAFDLLEVGMGIPVQLVGKQLLHRIPAKLTRRQAD